MKWIAIVSIVLSVACGALPSFAAPLGELQTETGGDPARALFITGRNLWDEGRFAEAEQKFREALSRYPHSDQADRIGFYHIETLSRMGRSKEALDEVNAFLKNFPQSKWWGDVQEKWIGMTGRIPAGAGPWAQNGWDAGLTQELLRALLTNDADQGIGVMKDRLKSDPSDPAVLANLNAVIAARTAEALPFLISMAKSSPSPNARTAAAFWLGRVTNDKDSAALKALAEISRTDKDVSVRRAAVQALAPHKEKIAVDAVAEFLKDPAAK